MKKKMSNKLFAGIWGAVIAVVVVVMIVANLVALSYTTIISTFLGHDTYRVEQLGESQGDSQYFKPPIPLLRNWRRPPLNLASAFRQRVWFC